MKAPKAIRATHWFRWMAVAIGLVVVGFIILSASGPASPPQAGSLIVVTFAGYSNAPDGQIIARFACSNLTSMKVRYLIPAPELSPDGQWRDFSSIITVGDALLRGHEQSWINILKPSGGVAWRVILFHAPEPVLWRKYLARIVRLVPWVPRNLVLRLDNLVDQEMRTSPFIYPEQTASQN